MKSEASIVRDILKFLRALPRCKAIKCNPPGVEAGTPDIFCLYEGQFYAIEVKRPGERPTKLQEKRLAQWRAAGAVAVWVDSVEALADLIRHPIYGVDNREPPT